jgi:hypothetical protein
LPPRGHPYHTTFAAGFHDHGQASDCPSSNQTPRPIPGWDVPPPGVQIDLAIHFTVFSKILSLSSRYYEWLPRLC